MIYHFKVLTKNIDFNDFIDAETLFDDIKFKNNEIWRCWKKSNGTSIKIKYVRMGGNKTNKQTAKWNRKYDKFLQITRGSY